MIFPKIRQTFIKLHFATSLFNLHIYFSFDTVNM
nr:MAG TPA: hypothetical protein [Caudoviricetes sp.]